MPDAGYWAPARFVLDRLHRRGDSASPSACAANEDRVTGWTVCGTPMLDSELWRALDFRQGDRLCPVCWYRKGAEIAATEEADGLW